MNTVILKRTDIEVPLRGYVTENERSVLSLFRDEEAHNLFVEILCHVNYYH